VLEPVGIDEQLDRPVEGGLQVDRPLFRARPQILHRGLDQSRGLDGPELQAQLRRRDAGQVGEVVDELRLGAQVALDRVERAGAFGILKAPSSA
jgi:hypothetical protein